MTALPNQFNLGDLHVDLWSQRVTRAEVQLSLPKLSLDLLLALARAAPKLVSIDELMTEVWPGLVVNPETVAQRVKMLRDALGDDPRAPRYIESVRSRGYRLLHEPAAVLPGAENRSASETPPPLATSTPVVPQPQAARREPSMWMSGWRLLAGILLIALLISVMLAIRAHRAQEPVTKNVLPERTVAVLPFANIGGESKDALLALGVAENIRLRLGALSEIVVIADTSIAGYNGTHVDATTVGRELNARYLLEGSLQRQNELMRITARLVDAEKGADVWSVYFDRKPSDIFAVQDEISTKVARALKVTLDADEEQRLQSRGTNNIDAYLEFLQARNSITSYRSADVEAAIAHYRTAIERDADFSAAYSGLAGALAATNAFGNVHRSADQLKSLTSEVYALIEKAQQLDPRNAESYMLLYNFEEDPVKAESYLRRALALEPNSARAHFLLAQSGDLTADSPSSYIGDKLFHEQKAMEIDPLNPAYPLALANEYLFHRTNESAAIEPLLMRSLELNPNYVQARESLALLRIAYQRRLADGIKIREQIVAQEKTATYYKDLLAIDYADAGDVSAAEDVIAGSAYTSSQIITLAARHQWREAVAAYAQPDDVLPSAFVETKYWFAMRMDAHQTGNYAAARKYFEDDDSIKWDKNGMPIVVIPMETHLYKVMSLADMLQKTGEPERARLILEASLVSIKFASEKFGRGDLILRLPRFQALALLGRDAEALAVLEQMAPGGGVFNWREFEVDPIFDRLRHEPRFINFLEQSRHYDQSQLALVQQMRDNGEIPQRPSHKTAQTPLPP